MGAAGGRRPYASARVRPAWRRAVDDEGEARRSRRRGCRRDSRTSSCSRRAIRRSPVSHATHIRRCRKRPTASWRRPSRRRGRIGTIAPTSEPESASARRSSRRFAAHDSRSVQHTLYAMGEAALAACGDITEVSLSMPNRHHLLVDLKPFGLDNPNEVFVATDQPFGSHRGDGRGAERSWPICTTTFTGLRFANPFLLVVRAADRIGVQHPARVRGGLGRRRDEDHRPASGRQRGRARRPSSCAPTRIRRTCR